MLSFRTLVVWHIAWIG